MLQAADLFVRRLFAWPLVFIGAIIVELGGLMIRTGAWIVDMDVSNID